ncbi:uncharacterized protein [Ptychodera flava]|uniref:uncharacterized protein n=1 Tax=Ptychodera flava TaxID=63121 RepID=UPI00396A7151
MAKLRTPFSLLFISVVVWSQLCGRAVCSWKIGCSAKLPPSLCGLKRSGPAPNSPSPINKSLEEFDFLDADDNMQITTKDLEMIVGDLERLDTDGDNKVSVTEFFLGNTDGKTQPRH